MVTIDLEKFAAIDDRITHWLGQDSGGTLVVVFGDYSETDTGSHAIAVENRQIADALMAQLDQAFHWRGTLGRGPQTKESR